MERCMKITPHAGKNTSANETRIRGRAETLSLIRFTANKKDFCRIMIKPHCDVFSKDLNPSREQSICCGKTPDYHDPED